MNYTQEMRGNGNKKSAIKTFVALKLDARKLDYSRRRRLVSELGDYSAVVLQSITFAGVGSEHCRWRRLAGMPKAIQPYL